MAEPITTPAPDIAKLIADAMGAATKPLLDKITALETKLASAPAAPAPAPVAPAPAADKPLTAAEVAKLLTDTLGARDASAATIAARSAYATDKLKDLPAVYRDRLPQTGDAGALATAEAQIRQQFAADMAAMGFKPANVTGTPPANGTAATKTPLDYSKLTPMQLLTEGAKQRSTPIANDSPAAVAALNAAK